jgi:hypothetical protein
LDVALEVHNSSWLLEPEWGLQPLRYDRGGRGVAESADYMHNPEGLAFLVVKHLSGRGRVVVSVSDPETGGARSYVHTLAGQLTGWVNSGQLPGSAGPSLVLTSTADIDPYARIFHALDSAGQTRPGWPAYIFLPAALQGPLTAPLVWDLDGMPGAEVIAASAFGRLYLVSGGGIVQERVIVAAGVPLTAPVGLVDPTGLRRLVVIDGTGRYHLLSADGSSLGSVPLGSGLPLAPAVGQLTADLGEEVLVGFPSGNLYGLSWQGAVLPGWPVVTAAAAYGAPVLVDFDGDGLHEVVMPYQPQLQGSELVFRVLHGDGQPALGDGALAVAPNLGRWLTISDPAVAGPQLGGGLRVVLSGLVAQPTAGQTQAWSLAWIALHADGLVEVQASTGLRVPVLTPSGQLQLLWKCLAPPLCWDYQSGGGTEAEFQLALGWQEDISGITNPRGAAMAWLRPEAGSLPLTMRQGLQPGGPGAADPASLSSGLYAVSEQDWYRISTTGRQITVQLVPALWQMETAWRSARADGRNSGAFPLPAGQPTALAADGPAGGRLDLWPNPGHGRLMLSWRGLAAEQAWLDVYDLRGHHLRSLPVTGSPSDGQLVWDGKDQAGRPVAAGTYLVVMRWPGGSVTRRAVLTR